MQNHLVGSLIILLIFYNWEVPFYVKRNIEVRLL